jgi:hypothetical protein
MRAEELLADSVRALSGDAGKESRMRRSEAEKADAPQANAPDARPATHDGSESPRAGNQPYASEGEDYQAENIETPKEPGADEGGSRRKDRR